MFSARYFLEFLQSPDGASFAFKIQLWRKFPRLLCILLFSFSVASSSLAILPLLSLYPDHYSEEISVHQSRVRHKRTSTVLSAPTICRWCSDSNRLFCCSAYVRRISKTNSVYGRCAAADRRNRIELHRHECME